MSEKIKSLKIKLSVCEYATTWNDPESSSDDQNAEGHQNMWIVVQMAVPDWCSKASQVPKKSRKDIESMTINEKYKEDIFNRRLDNMELSYRTENHLKQDNIKFVGDLVKLSKPELMRIPYIGRKSVNELIEVLNGMSLQLGMEPEEKSKEDKYLEVFENMPRGIETVYIRNAIDKINSRLDNIEQVLNYYNPTIKKEQNILRYL